MFYVCVFLCTHFVIRFLDFVYKSATQVSYFDFIFFVYCSAHVFVCMQFLSADVRWKF